MAELTQSQQAFVERYAPYANLASQQTGLPSRVILAKLALETQYGTRFANNNLPGLQLGNAAQNAGFTGRLTDTWEDRGGPAGGAASNNKEKAVFIRYPSPEQSIGGLVPWLSNSTYMSSLADRRGGGIFNRDPAAEASAVSALGTSGFSTDRNARRGVTSILGRLPDLDSYGIAPSFDPTVVQLLNYVPYNSASREPDVSAGLGPITDNNYNTGTQYQPEGQVQSRERGARGVQLPGPGVGTGAGGASSPGVFDALSDALTRGVEGAANIVRDAGGQAFNAVSGALTPQYDAPVGGFDFGDRFDAAAYLATNPDVARDAQYAQNPFSHYLDFGQAEGRDLYRDAGVQTAAPGAFDFSGRNVSGGASLGSLGSGVVPSVNNQTFAGTFNPNAYLAANADVRAAGVNPWEHYLESGIREGRAIDQAGTRFNPELYQAQNADVLAAGMDPLMHYAQFGAGEGRAAPLIGPNGVASGVMSLGLTPTVGPDSVTRFRAPDGYGFQIGAEQAATLPPGFNEQAYLRANPDVAAAGIPAAQHYLTSGIYEGRTLGPSFSDEAYYQANPDVRGVMGAQDHARLFAAPEGRALGAGNFADLIGPGSSFNAASYLAANPDVAMAGMDPVVHARDYAIPEGRSLGIGNTADLIPAGPSVQATSPTGGGSGGFGNTNVSGGVPNGSFGSGLMPNPASMDGYTLPPGFSEQGYLIANPDVAASIIPAAQHYRDFGAAEGRSIGPTFSEEAYYRANPDVQAAGIDAYDHYRDFGIPEGRTLGAGNVAPLVFPNSFVQATSPGEMAMRETSTIAPSWSDEAYYQANPDVRAAGIPAQEHARNFGIPEGRTLGPGNTAALIPAGAAVQATSPFGANASATAGAGGGFNGTGSINLGMGGQGPITSTSFGIGTNVSGFDPNSAALSGGQPADWGGAFRPGFTGYGSPEAANSSALSQNAYFASQAIDRVNADAQNQVNELNGQPGTVAFLRPAMYGFMGGDQPQISVSNTNPTPAALAQEASVRSGAQTIANNAQNFFASVPRGGPGGSGPAPLQTGAGSTAFGRR